MIRLQSVTYEMADKQQAIASEAIGTLLELTKRLDGDFCCRFSTANVLQLMNAFNRIREKVWKQQPDELF